METEELKAGNVHHGHNIRRTRIDKNIKQEALSELVNMTQSNISKYENQRVIEDVILHRFAKALDVPFEYLKTLEESAPTVVFENNTINNKGDHSGVGSQAGYENMPNNYFNPIERVAELYERLLKEKDEKYAALERRLQSVEKSINEKR